MVAPAPAPRMVVPSNSSSNIKWILGGVGLALVAALAWFLLGSNLLKAEGKVAKGDLLKAQGTAVPGKLIQAEGRAASPEVIQSQGRQAVVMPADIRAWLEHLERIERKRVDLAGRQMSQSLVLMAQMQGGGLAEFAKGLLADDPATAPDPPTPRDTMKDEAAPMKQAWTDLNREFNAVAPPTECVPIRSEYDQALGETAAMIGDLIDVISNANENPAGAIDQLRKVQGTSKDHIDAAAKRTDALVQKICDKYETKKWFDVTGDVGGNMLSKFAG